MKIYADSYFTSEDYDDGLHRIDVCSKHILEGLVTEEVMNGMDENDEEVVPECGIHECNYENAVTRLVIPKERENEFVFI